MPYLSSYEHDIFISYAHGPQPAASFSGDRPELLRKWTFCLIDHLCEHIGLYLVSRSQQVDIWIDQILEGNRALGENLRSKVEKSAIFIAVVSPYYLESPWCMEELACFVETRQNRDAREQSIFVIRAFPTDETSWPEQLKDREGQVLPGYWFYEPVRSKDIIDPYGWPKPTEVDKPYWEQVQRLAKQLVDRLKAMKASEAETDGALGPTCLPQPAGTDVVLLGYVHDTLEEIRNSLNHSLLGRGIQVLPHNPADIYDEHTLRNALKTYLREVNALVLVANEYCGRWPVGEEAGSISFQLGQSKAAGIPAYLWLTVDDPQSIKSETYRHYVEQLMGQASQASSSLQLRHKDPAEFADYVAGTLHGRTTVEPGVEQLAVVCSNLASEDPCYAQFHEIVLEALGEMKRVSIVVAGSAEDGQIQLQTLEKQIGKADTLVVVCFDQDWDWALPAITELWKLCDSPLMPISAARSHSLKRAKLLVAGPQDRNRGLMDARAFHFRTIDGRHRDAEQIKEEIKHHVKAVLEA